MSGDQASLRHPVGGASATARAWALLIRLRSPFMVMVSQGSANLGFFLTNLILLRSVAPAEFGAYAIVVGLLPFASNLYAAFITYPATLRLTEPGADAPGILGATIVTSLALSVPIAVTVFVAALVVANTTVATCASLASVVWLAQSAASRTLLAQLKIARAAIGDVICYLGIPAGVLWSLHAGSLSIAVPFFTLMLTAGLALFLQAWQCDIRIRHLRPSRTLFRHFWLTGRVIVLGPLTEGIISQLALWVLLATHGKGAVAVFAAMRSLAGISHPLIFSILNLVVPVVARVRHHSDAHAAVAKGASAAAPLALAALALHALLAMFAFQIITLVYGAGMGYPEHAVILRILALSYVFLTLSECTSAILRGLANIGAETKAQLTGSAAGLVSLPLIAFFGLIASALWLAPAFRFGVGLSAILRVLRREAITARPTNGRRSPAGEQDA